MYKMKINIKTVLISVFILAVLPGCNSFLDVDPVGTVTEDKQFKDMQGYKDAMYGIYASMGKTDLYGQNLSWGFTDHLAQLFYRYKNSGGKFPEADLANHYKYDDAELVPLIDAIWSKTYTTISYVNNVLKHLDNINTDEDYEYSLIKGEALGVRAYLHFDIIRLFADNIILDPGAGGIPYAYEFDLNNKKLFTLKECYDNLLKDLDEAEIYLAKDSVLNNSVDNTQANTIPTYQATRSKHCNKYAVWALRARILHYMGDLQQAGYYAEKIISSTEFALSDRENSMALTISKEGIWSLYTNQILDAYKNMYLPKETSSATGAMNGIKSNYCLAVRADVADIYNVNGKTAENYDTRFDKFFSEDPSVQGYYNFVRLFNPVKNSKLENISLIRLPEMYYIAAEAYYKTDPAKAIRYLEAVRYSRHLAPLDTQQLDTEDEFMKELVLERTRETWGEGQLFFYYKRNNMNIRSGANDIEYQASRDIYVLPWPERELEFGESNK